MGKLQTNIDNYEKGVYEGFKIGNVVRYKDDSWYGYRTEPYNMVISDIIIHDKVVHAILRKRVEVGKKRSSFYAQVKLEHLKKVK